MFPRRFAIWQKLAALAPMLLLALAAPGQELLRCQIDGMLRPSCCCPAEKATERGHGPVIKTAGCCDRTATASNRAPAEDSRTEGRPCDAAPIQATADPLYVSFDHPGRALPARQSHGPPRDGPAVLLLKSTFLI